MENNSSWIYNQAGVIPFRAKKDKTEILLITSRSRRRWIIPKGIIDPGFSAAETAVNEAFEEAGIKGKIGSEPVGEYRFKKWGGEVTVQVYPFEVKQVFKKWPEDFFRQRKWVSIEEAADLVAVEGLKNILQNMKINLKKNKGFKT